MTLIRAFALTAALAVGFPLHAFSADMNKIIRIALVTGETGLDPVRNTDSYSNGIIEQIYEPLLTYDYLARPAKLSPLTAESMPQVTDGGKTWLIKVRKGVFFHDELRVKRNFLPLLRKSLEYAEWDLELIANAARCHHLDPVDVLRRKNSIDV